MGSYRVRMGLDFTLAATTWNIVRGMGVHSYNANYLYASGQTGWTLDSAPAGFSISSNGVIETDDITHAYALGVSGITINTDDGPAATIPMTIRDYFPSDFTPDPVRFHSAFRSWNSDANVDLWLADFFSPISPAAFTTAEVTAQTGADGYIDIDQLETDCAAIGETGILEIKTIYDQRDGFNGPWHMEHDDQQGDRLLAGTMEDGTLSLLTQNGRPYFRSVWSPAALNSAWTAADRLGTKTIAPAISGTPAFSDTFGLFIVVRRHGGASEDLRTGDANAYPGLRASGSLGLRFSSNVRPGDLSLTTSEIENWFVWHGHSARNPSDSSNWLRDHHIYRLAGTGDNNTASEEGSSSQISSVVHQGGGAEIEAEEWEWAEMTIFNIAQTSAAGTTYRDAAEILVDNLVAVFGGNTFTYS